MGSLQSAGRYQFAWPSNWHGADEGGVDEERSGEPDSGVLELERGEGAEEGEHTHHHQGRRGDNPRGRCDSRPNSVFLTTKDATHVTLRTSECSELMRDPSGRPGIGPAAPTRNLKIGRSVRPCLRVRERVLDSPQLRLATGHSTVAVLGETAFQSGGSSWSGRSAGSEAGVLPAPLLAVAGAGGMGAA